MKPLSQLIQQPKLASKSNIRCERDEWLQKFYKRINDQRKGTKYGEYTMKALSIRLAQSGVKDSFDMKTFYDNCDNSDNFSRLFFGLTKTKKV
jgi:hypothetical protein